ncbi:MAG: CsoS2 family carboxysome shell protein [Chromatiales bacterium]|nr:CsoS2 family carboxysome shell protein [Chromatiales bacterium]
MGQGREWRCAPRSGNGEVVVSKLDVKRITGVDVEYNTNVSGDEYGVCASITGTLSGPGEYEAFCETADASTAAQRVARQSAGINVTGDTALQCRARHRYRSVVRIAHLTGTSYYREETEATMQGDAISHLNSRFSVRSPR